MKYWFYNKLYLLVAAANEFVDLVSAKLTNVEEKLYWQSENEKRGDVSDCKSNRVLEITRNS